MDRILVADDQPDVLESLRMLFRNEGFAMDAVNSPAAVLEAIRRQAQSEIQARHIAGSRFRNFHAAIQLRGLVSRRVAFPAYVIAYRYRTRLYRTVISGQNSACIIGNAPRSVAKVILVIVATLLALGALALGLLLRLK